MAEQSIACPSCGKKVPLTRALRAEIEQSVKQEFEETLHARERELRAKFEQRLEDDLQRAHKDAAKRAERKMAQELAALREQIKDQARDLDDARRNELTLRKRERDLERKQEELELEVERQLGKERARLVTDVERDTELDVLRPIRSILVERPQRDGQVSVWHSQIGKYQAPITVRSFRIS